MTTVNISATFSKKQRPDNGLERTAEYIDSNRLARVPSVCIVEWHGGHDSLTGRTVAVAVRAIEPGIDINGGPVPGLPVHDGFPTDAAGQIMWLLDNVRRTHGKGNVQDTLFSPPSGELGGDPDDEELPGQMVIPTETRLGADGEHVVPPASGEEILAERAETKAAVTFPTAVDDKDADLRRRVTGSSEAPAAAFSGAES
jgi:hypothetical protein